MIDSDDDLTVTAVPNASKHDYFLQKAMDAEEFAERHPECSADWMKIAQGYRSMAGSYPKSKA